MITGVEKFKCGSCEADTYRIFGENDSYPSKLYVECTGCKNIVEIKVTFEPLLEIKHVEGDGTALCIY